MDFKEWLNEIDDSDMSAFDYLVFHSFPDPTDVAALSALLEKAFNAGVASGIDAAMDYL
jgi:hypothetical protein